MGTLTGLLQYTPWMVFLRYFAGFMLIAMGLYIADWWRGLAWVERAGAVLWRPVQGVIGRFHNGGRWYHALVLGLCWGMMPCGLIYSSLAWAAAAANPWQSGLLMLLFGLGTLPVMLAASLGAGKLQSFLRRRGFKLLIAVMLIAFGSWTLYLTYSHSGHGPATASGMDHSQHH
jgi:sulfite exporter TauE/SafE